MGWPKDAFLYLRQIATPKSRPASGGNLLYTKSDNNLYLLNADGTEHQVGGSGASLTVQDENGTIATGVNQIDFQGAGVTASAGTGEVVVTIPGASGLTDPTTTKGDIIVRGASAATRLGVGTDGNVLAAYAAATNGLEYVPSSVPPILLDYGSPVPSNVPVGTLVFWKKQVLTSTTWDFRGLSALPSGWARSGVASESFSSSGMSATYGAGQRHFYTITPGVLGTLEVKMVSGPTSGAMAGPQVFDQSSNLGATMSWYSAPSGALLLDLGSTHAYSSTTFANAGGTPAYPVWFRIRLAAGAAFGSYSTNGTSWSSEVTITRAGVDSVDEIALGGALSTAAVTWEYAKWTPTGAALSGGLQGWWDGSVVQSFT